MTKNKTLYQQIAEQKEQIENLECYMRTLKTQITRRDAVLGKMAIILTIQLAFCAFVLWGMS